MALTVTEATALNDLLNHVTGCSRPGGGPVTAGEAIAAANVLAQSAYKRLMAGWRGDGDLEGAWPVRPAGDRRVPAGTRRVEFKTLCNAALHEWWEAVIPEDAEPVVAALNDELYQGRCDLLREEAFDEHDREIIEVQGTSVSSPGT